jgi:2OG-Fe(II) oxygenase superfamily
VLQIAASSVPSQQLSIPLEDELARMSEEFRRRRCLVIPGLIEGSLADELARLVDGSIFYRREHDGIGVEECMEVNAALAWLLLLINDERLLGVIRSITGCASIGRFDGRVYRLAPSTDHHDSWHDDVGDNRLVAMSINLGLEAYEGGTLQLRDRGSGETVEAKSVRLGDALLFALGERLEHRVSPVTGDRPRVVFAGWFKAGEDFLAVLRSASTAGGAADGRATGGAADGSAIG